MNWTRSSKCESQACVEVAGQDGDVLVRDSKNPESQVLRFSMAEWDDFRAAVLANEFPVG